MVQEEELKESNTMQRSISIREMIAGQSNALQQARTRPLQDKLRHMKKGHRPPGLD